MIVPFYDLARGHHRLSFLVDVLLAIILDMMWFMVIVAFVILVLAYTFMLLATKADSTGEENVNEYAGVVGSIFTAWRLYLLGDFEPDTYAETIAMLVAFFMTTVLFNLVINNAVMYARRPRMGKPRHSFSFRAAAHLAAAHP